MKHEKILLDKLHDNFGSCVLIGQNDLLSTKLEKYLKRYMGKSVRLGYEVVDSNSQQDLFHYLSFIAPKQIVLIVDDFTSLTLIEKIRTISGLLDRNAILILSTKNKGERALLASDKLICVPNLYGFNEELGELEQNSNDGVILADEAASIIAKAIADDDIKNLEAELEQLQNKNENCIEIAEKQKGCSLRLLYKGDPNEIILGKNVGEFRINLGMTLADTFDEEIVSKLDYIVPVPSSGIFYAVGLSKALNLPFLPALRKLDISERAFEIQNVDMRKSYLSRNMEVNGHLIKGKKLLVVDEAIFTGATLKVVCELLKENGAAEVHLAIASPKCYKNCEYLVQPDRTMLLNKINEAAISSYLDVESVTYVELEDYENILKSVTNVCIDCFHRPKAKGE